MIKRMTFAILILFLSACGSEPALGPLELNGPAETRDLYTSVEVVPNCTIGQEVSKQPAMNTSLDEGVEWEVNGNLGVGFKIGGGLIPGGVDLTPSLGKKVVTQIGQGGGQSVGWSISAANGYIVTNKILWQEEWQPAYINVSKSQIGVRGA